MNCPNCKNDMVSAKATNFGEEYWYCRTCKKELDEIKISIGGDKFSLKQITASFKELLNPSDEHDWAYNINKCINCNMDISTYVNSGGILRCPGPGPKVSVPIVPRSKAVITPHQWGTSIGMALCVSCGCVPGGINSTLSCPGQASKSPQLSATPGVHEWIRDPNSTDYGRCKKCGAHHSTNSLCTH